MPRQVIAGCQGRVVTDHRVKRSDDFSDAGGESDLLVFASADQALLEAFDIGVEASCDHRGEIERGARVSATTADATFTVEFAAIAIERSDAGEGSDLAAIESAEFREVTEESGSDGVANARH